jgi:hypothetical protein
MTDIDRRSDIRTVYSEDDLIVLIPLAGEVTERWSRRYEALARAKGMRAKPYNRDGCARIHLAVPLRAEGEDVLKMLDAARSLISEADAVEQSPAPSNSPEAIATRWWARQQEA